MKDQITKKMRQEINKNIINEKCNLLTDYITSELNKAQDENYRNEVSIPYVLGTLMQVLKSVNQDIQIIKNFNNK
jgi:hypothetical protein